MQFVSLVKWQKYICGLGFKIKSSFRYLGAMQLYESTIQSRQLPVRLYIDTLTLILLQSINVSFKLTNNFDAIMISSDCMKHSQLMALCFNYDRRQSWWGLVYIVNTSSRFDICTLKNRTNQVNTGNLPQKGQTSNYTSGTHTVLSYSIDVNI